MTLIAPSTDLYLLKLPIELNDENQLTFDTVAAQTSYFQSLEKIGETDFTYQRRENAIRYPAQLDSILQFNYVMYKNDAYSNKWFYARITNMQYVNDGMTLITIEEDSFQTWQFDLIYYRCFVEREHVDDDTPGIHTVDEGLETGEYQILDKKNIPLYETATPANDWVICFCVTKLPQGTQSIVGEGLSIGGVFTSLHFFAVAGWAQAYAVIKLYEAYDSSVTSDAIKNIYMVPQTCIEPTQNPTQWTFTAGGTTFTISAYALKDSTTAGPYSWNQPSTLAGGYSPKNNKLFAWPYSYAYFSNKAGDELVVHWEDFPIVQASLSTGRTIEYKKAIVPSTSISAKLYLTKYKGYAETSDYGSRLYEYGINYAKAPVCAWTTDYYTNWLTQNGVNMATGLTSSVIGGGLAIAGAAIAGGPVGLAVTAAALGTATNVASTLAQNHQASVTPGNAYGDQSMGDVMFAYNKCSIGLYYMTIKPEMAAILDGYFSCYGYKVNIVKVPQIHTRVNWNYIKTIGSAIQADAPQDTIDHINRMFDHGLTLWHNPNTFRNYDMPNSIIS